jgi:hypothetical protein
MLVEVVVVRPEHAPDFAEWLIRAGWITIFVAPLITAVFSSRPRPVTLDVRSLSSALIAGASAARTKERFSVLLMKKRAALPITLDVPNEESALAVLAEVGIARTGSITWPLRPGGFDRFRLAVSITWRVAMLASYVPVQLVSLAGFAFAVLAGLLAMGLAFVPATGPHLELTDEQLRGDDLTVPLRDIAEVSATETALVVRLKSEQTITIDAPTTRFSRRALTTAERAHLVAHVNAAVAPTRRTDCATGANRTQKRS